MDPNTPHRAEAERWLGIAAKLLTARDFLGSKTFAIRAKESDPNNDVADQILAVLDTVLAGEKRVNSAKQPDWYTVLQLPKLVRDQELIANHYRRLVLLLNPERNRLPFADYALQMVMEAWAVLSDPGKKWLFDNELAVYLHRAEQQMQPPLVRVEAMRADADPHYLSSAAAAVVGATSAAATNQSQVSTFQFFQPQPPPPQPTVSMWQQQHEYHHCQNLNLEQHHQQQRNTNQLHQIEFMQPPSQLSPPPQQQRLQPQWQMRDPTPVKAGERNWGLGGESVMRRGADVTSGGTVLTPIRTTPRPAPVPPQPQPVVALAPPQPQPVAASEPPQPQPAVAPVPPQPQPVVTPARVEVVAASTRVVDGNVDNRDGNNAGVVHQITNNNDDNTPVAPAAAAPAAAAAANENNNNGVAEEVECFWTSCPYCYYIYEYKKMYKDCTLRCQTCRRGFHAVQIPNPPPISGIGGEGKGNKESSSFCCWGFFPLGFSTAAWRKQNKMGKANVASNWVPFSSMFTCPVENGGGGFQWFESNDGAVVGPKSVGRPPILTPRIYMSDDDDDFVSDPSDSDSSDKDWRRNPVYEKKKRKMLISSKAGRPRNGRPRKMVQYQANQDLSVGGRGVQDASARRNVVVGLSALTKEESGKNKKPAATLTKNQARRRVKNTGRLDLNVEFNNEGDEHAPTVSAVNGEEVGIENIGFFEGLDEFFSTLPILNVSGEEKAKPS